MRNAFCGLDDSIGYLARIVSRRFVMVVEKRISQFEITVGQYVLLRLLWTKDGEAQHRLGTKLGICEPTVAIGVRKLELIGLVRREKNVENRREMLVHLTHVGRNLRSSLESISHDTNQIVCELHSLLRRAINNLSADA